MKKYYISFGFLLITVLCICSLSTAQPVTELITFDNYVNPTDNDLVNNFYNGPGLNQIPANGITGGCVTTPATESWGNDNAIYCFKYLNAPSYQTSTRISFKYDTTLINTVNYDRAVTIYLRPSANYNNYVIASLMHDKKLQIITYGWVNNMPTVNLVHDHWYELKLNTSVLATFPSVYTEAEVFDLGTTGLVTPVSVGSSSGTFGDSIFYDDPAIEVSFSATQWGGAKFADQFYFQGEKSADSCTATTVTEIYDNSPVIFIENNSLIIHNGAQYRNVAMFNISGQLLFSSALNDTENVFDVSASGKGIYLLQLSNEKSCIRKKLFID